MLITAKATVVFAVLYLTTFQTVKAMFFVCLFVDVVFFWGGEKGAHCGRGKLLERYLVT